MKGSVHIITDPDGPQLMDPTDEDTGKNNSMLCRYDAYKKAQSARLAEQGIPLPSGWYRLSYFHCSLFGYFLGLLTATITSEVKSKECIYLTEDK
jgi:hypothetical protein